MTMPQPELSPLEQMAVNQLTEHILASREEQSEKVQTCLDALSETDEPTRLVARVSIAHYLETTDTTDLLSKPFLRNKAYRMAPGLFMAFMDLYEDLVDTGEFLTTDMLRGSAESLGFDRTKGLDAAGFLFQWTAAQYPGSKAVDMVRDYGLRSGRMSKNFNTSNLLFHETLAQQYIESTHYAPREALDPIIVLAATDDWERATSLLPPRQRQRPL